MTSHTPQTDLVMVRKWTWGSSITLKKRYHDDDSTRRVLPILYLVKLFTFLSRFLPFPPSFNLQKPFLMFSISTIYPKYILRKQFLQKSFSAKNKNKKKLFIFFFSFFFFFRFFFFFFFFFDFVFRIFFFFFFFLCPKPTQHLFLSILL